MSKPVNWRHRYDTLLALVLQWRNEPGSKYHDCRLHSDAVEKLHRIAEANKRYEWRKVGETFHLFPAFDKRAQSVAFVVKERAGKYVFTIMAKGYKSITDSRNTESKAKQAIEKHFEMLQTETE